MILYQVYSEYNIFQAFVHKETYFPKEEAILIIGERKELRPPRIISWNWTESYEKYSSLFERIIVTEKLPAYTGANDEFQKNINEYYNALLLSDGINLSEISQAVTFCLNERFSVFCFYNDIPLSACELEPGTVHTLKTVKKFEEKFLEYIYKRLEPLGLYGDPLPEKLCKMYCNFAAQEKDTDLSLYQDFNVFDKLLKLAEEKRNLLYEIYGIDSSVRASLRYSTICLTSTYLYPDTDNFVNHEHDLYTFEKQRNSHNILLDLFTTKRDKLVLLNGLNDNFDYRKYNSQLTYIFDNKIPPELLASLPEITSCKVIAAVKQDGYCFKEMAHSYLEFSTRFQLSWQKYRFFDSAIVLQTAIELISKLKLSGYTVSYFNIPDMALRLFNEILKSDQKPVWVNIRKPLNKSIVFINDGNYGELADTDLPDIMRSESKDSIYIFLNQRQLYTFMNTEKNTEDLIAFSVDRKEIEDTLPQNELTRQVFWIYCPDKKIMAQLQNMLLVKKYYNSGFCMTCEPLNSLAALNDYDIMYNQIESKEVVLYGRKSYIEKNISLLKEKVSIKSIYITDNDGRKDIMNIPVMDQFYYNKNTFVLISTNDYSEISSISDFLYKNNLGFFHSDWYLSSNIPLAAMIAMKKYEYIDMYHNHYYLDSRIRIEDAEKIQLSFFQDVPRYNNIFKIGMIRIVNQLKISVKGNYNTVSIGDNTTFQHTTIELCQNAAVKIGESCMFSYGIVLYRDDMHVIYDADTKERLNYPKDIIIGDHVWVGREVMILGGAEIGNNNILGARCVTSGKFKEAGCVIAGCPGKKIRENIIWSRDGYEDGSSNLYDVYDRIF